jgi:hypothetical protein
MSKLATLLAKDGRAIYRDGVLLPLALYPLVVAVIARLFAGWAPIEHLDLYLAPAVFIVGALVVGTVFGFTLIEEREQQTWLLLRVIPLRQSTLLAYLVATTAGFALLVGLASSLVYGLPLAKPASFVALAVAGSLTAPLLAFTLGALAANKIEGFALGKILGVLPALPALVFLLSPNWQVLLAWNPFYWLYLGMLGAYGADPSAAGLAVRWPGYPAWSYLLAPTVLSLAGIALLGSTYRRRAG